jgi:hypothetical protein
MSTPGSQCKIALVAPFIAVLIATGNSVGQVRERPCTPAEAQRAEKEAETFRTWGALYQSFRVYGRCDDGAIAEGYSESVARILVDHWDTLNQLVLLGNKDRAFRNFVIRHVDSTVKASDVDRIKMLAKTGCPKGSRALCDDLILSAMKP